MPSETQLRLHLFDDADTCRRCHVMRSAVEDSFVSRHCCGSPLVRPHSLSQRVEEAQRTAHECELWMRSFSETVNPTLDKLTEAANDCEGRLDACLARDDQQEAQITDLRARLDVQSDHISQLQVMYRRHESRLNGNVAHIDQVDESTANGIKRVDERIDGLTADRDRIEKEVVTLRQQVDSFLMTSRPQMRFTPGKIQGLSAQAKQEGSVICKSCNALVGPSFKYCAECGMWLGRHTETDGMIKKGPREECNPDGVALQTAQHPDKRASWNSALVGALEAAASATDGAGQRIVLARPEYHFGGIDYKATRSNFIAQAARMAAVNDSTAFFCAGSSSEEAERAYWANVGKVVRVLECLAPLV